MWYITEMARDIYIRPCRPSYIAVIKYQKYIDTVFFNITILYYSLACVDGLQ